MRKGKEMVDGRQEEQRNEDRMFDVAAEGKNALPNNPEELEPD